MATITLKDGNEALSGDYYTDVIMGKIIYEDEIKVTIHNGKYKESFLKTDILALIE